MPFKVRALWSTPDEREPSTDPVEYEFATEAELTAFVDGIETGFGNSHCPSFATEDELNAFFDGVDATVGWSVWHRFDPNPDGSWPVESGPVDQDEDE